MFNIYLLPSNQIAADITFISTRYKLPTFADTFIDLS